MLKIREVIDNLLLQVCILAEKSIYDILNSNDNFNFLLGLHRQDNKAQASSAEQGSRSISTP